MPRTAFALTVPDDRVACWRTHAAAALGPGAGVHRQRLLERGIVREQIWLQRLPSGESLAVVVWDCDNVQQALGLGRQGGPAQDDLATDDLLGATLRPWPPPAVRVLGGSTAIAGPAPAALTFAVPLPPGAGPQFAAAWHDEGRHPAHERFLRATGVREEWLWLQDAHPAPPFGPEQGAPRPAAGSPAGDPSRAPGEHGTVIVHWLCDAPLGALLHLQGGHDAATQLLADVLASAGIDGSRPPAEMVIATHVRRTDRQGTAVGVALRSALAGVDVGALTGLLAEGCELVIVGAEGRQAHVHGPRAVAVTIASWVSSLAPTGRRHIRAHGTRDELALLISGVEGDGLLWCELADERIAVIRAAGLPATISVAEDEVVGFAHPVGESPRASS